MRQTGRLWSENEQPPAAAVKYLAEQLGIDARLYELYAHRVQTRFDHSRHLSLRMQRGREGVSFPELGNLSVSLGTVLVLPPTLQPPESKRPAPMRRC
ncbi:hypothetical protein MPLB_1700025 [Mesorhizobium sp. ORS 3324]|nr:hypothetical protein MPLB_1700025 [Mesorhizobium sp. ORS 3324]